MFRIRDGRRVLARERGTKSRKADRVCERHLEKNEVQSAVYMYSKRTRSSAHARDTHYRMTHRMIDGVGRVNATAE
jgi:hypothetical protein